MNGVTAWGVSFPSLFFAGSKKSDKYEKEPFFAVKESRHIKMKNLSVKENFKNP